MIYALMPTILGAGLFLALTFCTHQYNEYEHYDDDEYIEDELSMPEVRHDHSRYV